MPSRDISNRTLARESAFCARANGSFFVAALLSLALVGCAGTGPPVPRSGYRAEVTVRMTDVGSGVPAIERVVEFYEKGRRRRHARIDGEALTVIDRPDLRVSWKLHPATKTFDEYEITDREAGLLLAPDPFGPRYKAHFDWIRTETVDGVATHKYAVKGEAITGYAWLTDDKIPFRFSGTIESSEGARQRTSDAAVDLEVEYSGIERSSQEAFLFVIPPSYVGYENRKQKFQSQAESEAERERLRQQVRDMPDLPTMY